MTEHWILIETRNHDDDELVIRLYDVMYKGLEETQHDTTCIIIPLANLPLSRDSSGPFTKGMAWRWLFMMDFTALAWHGLQ